MRFFTGVFQHSIDSEGQVMLPSEILGPSSWPHATAWLICGEQYSYSVAPIAPAVLKQQAASESLSIEPIELAIKDGYLYLTTEICERLGERALYIVCVNDRIELWPASLWEVENPCMDPQIMMAELDKLLQTSEIL